MELYFLKNTNNTLYVNKNGFTIKNMLIIGGYDGFVKKANRTQNTFAIKIRLWEPSKKV